MMNGLNKVFSSFLSLIISSSIYPFLTKAIRNNASFYGIIYSKIESTTNINKSLILSTKKLELNKIHSLKIPQILIDKLVENNNSEIYKILDVSTIGDYINAYLTNTVINIFALIFIFLIVTLVIKVLVKSIQNIFKLNLLKQVDSISGGFFGLISGIIFIWFMMAIFTVFFAQGSILSLKEQIEISYLGKIFFETNIITNIITNIKR